MPAAQKATIAADINDEIKRWLFSASSYMDASSFQFKSWARAVEKLFSVDAVNGSAIRSMLFHCAGDKESALYWSENVRKLGSPDQADYLEGVLLSNLGYFSQATERLFRLDAPGRVKAATMLIIGGAFDEYVEALKKVDTTDPELHRVANVAARCAMTLKALNITQEHLRKVIDLAGAVLREHSLFFQEELPVVRALDDCFLYQLKIDVEPSEAALMTREVVARMVADDLDLPGLSFAFLGTRH